MGRAKSSAGRRASVADARRADTELSATPRLSAWSKAIFARADRETRWATADTRVPLPVRYNLSGGQRWADDRRRGGRHNRRRRDLAQRSLGGRDDGQRDELCGAHRRITRAPAHMGATIWLSATP